jgi:3-hydroxyisobutyrate dehydrogenase-like beta-hydroxyacid dehydrogenase
VATVRPVLSSYGDPILHVGPLGAGQKVKLVNNALFAAQIGLLSDAVELAGAFVGKDIAVVRQIAAELGSDLGVLDDVINAVLAGAK